MPDFTHTQEAIAHAQAGMGWTGFDLDDFATANDWQGVGIVPASGIHRDSDALARSNAYTEKAIRKANNAVKGISC